MKKQTWKQIAKRNWPKPEWMTGNGRFAVLAHCRVLTITLWQKIEEAQLAKHRIDKYACGGMCCGHHAIVDLETGKTIPPTSATPPP